jgi:hypothetical protein
LNCNDDDERDSVYLTRERESKEKKEKENWASFFFLESVQKQKNEACCKQEKKIELVQM